MKNFKPSIPRPDISFKVKVLTTRYEKGTKHDLMRAIKVLQKVKRKTTRITIPEMGEIKDCVLVAYSDAATKKIDDAFSVAGHVVFIVGSADIPPHPPITSFSYPAMECARH